MNEEWKVYVRGVEGRGDEVIRTLVALGGRQKPDCPLTGNCSDVIYAIGHDGYIGGAHITNETAKIIMDFYREIELPELWKDGDILFIKEGAAFVVFRRYAYMDGNGRNHFETYICIDENRLYLTDAKEIKGYPRLATLQEIEHFHELLHKHGKEWDIEKKQLVEWKWKPENGETIYYIDNDGEVESDTWDGVDQDIDRYNFGNCFRTNEEAESMVEKIKKLLKGE